MDGTVRPRPVMFWLGWLAVVGVVPAWLVTALTITASYYRERATLQKDTIATARVLSQVVDRDLAAAIAALQALALSPHLAAGDFATFRDQARQVLQTQSGSDIVVVDPGGQLLMSTGHRSGTALPRTAAPALLRTVLATAKPAVSDFYVGASSGQPQIGVSVPVIRGGKVIDVLSMGIRPERLAAILRAEKFPATWVGCILDKNGTIIARSDAAEPLAERQPWPALLRATSANDEGIVETDSPGHSAMLVAFSHSDLAGWVVGIAIPTAQLTANLRRWWWFGAAGASAVFVVALVLARLISLRIARSIQALTGSALALASDVPITIPPVTIREAAEVGDALIHAQHLLQERTSARDRAEMEARERQSELAHFSRVSLAGEMAAGIAHELSQPLTAIVAFGRGCLRMLGGPTTDRDLLKEGLGELVTQAERAGEVLVRLRDFVAHGASRRRPVAPKLLIDAAVSFAAFETGHTQVAITAHADPRLPPVLADEIQIEQVIVNLLRNAIESLQEVETGPRRIAVEAHRREDGRIEISVHDNGPGVPEALRDAIFEPFASSKRRGMGMGLAISRTIVEAHGGALRLQSGGGSGATFVFDLPTTAAEVEAHAG